MRWLRSRSKACPAACSEPRLDLRPRRPIDLKGAVFQTGCGLDEPTRFFRQSGTRMATNFNTSNSTWRQLMGNGLLYRVPPFQRDYSWGEEEWEDLWHDIGELMRPEGEPAHYMGYLVLRSGDGKQFDIIDGQQRLATLSILVLAAMRQLQVLLDKGRDAENTRKRLESLRQGYIGYLDPVTLVSHAKLKLNRNNDNYFQTYLVPLAASLPRRGFRRSEHDMRKAFEWFDRRFQDYLQDEEDPGLAAVRLIDGTSDKLVFTVITVTDELNAYRVFETLNARGVRLSATDLLKNYLFSLLHRQGEHEREIETLEGRWNGIVGRLGEASFPDFLRVHWIARRGTVRLSNLFKAVRDRVRDRGGAFALLRELEADIDAYLGLTQPDGSDWPAEWKRHARTLRMFSVRQPFPLLLAARRALDDAGFERLLRCVVVISFRYNVIGGLHGSEQERIYHAEAQRISRGEHSSIRQIMASLRPVYPDDKRFRLSFGEKSIGVAQARNRRVVRYVLFELERRASGKSLDFEDSRITLEHVLPLKPEDGWSAFGEADLDAQASRLGNMALLEAGPNRNAGNAGYEAKRAVFGKSRFTTTRDIASKYAEWTPEAIEARQDAMGRDAAAVWRIDFPD